MRLSPTFMVLPLAAAMASPSYADSSDEQKLEETVVTASRVEKPLATIPNTITVIGPDALQAQLSIHYDLSTVLGNLIPSFSPSRQKMTNAGESLRGRKPLYMIDGVPQSNPLRSGGRDGHTIDPAVIERVEVLHGANAIHGLGAAGGVINLITKKPSDELNQSFRVDSSFQLEDLSESLGYGVGYSFSNSEGAVDWLGSLNYRATGMSYDAEGEFIGVDNTQGDMMDSDSLNVFLKGGYNWGDQRLELMLNRYNVASNHEWISVRGDLDTGLASGAEKGQLPAEGARNKVQAVSLNYSNDEFFGQALSVQAFRQDFEATYGAQVTPIATFQDSVYGEDLIDQSQNNSEKVGVKITASKDDIAGSSLNAVYGIDFLQDETWQALIQTERAWVPETQYQNIAPFAQLEYTGIDKLTLAGGLRHEESTLTVDDFTTLASYGSRFVEGGKPEFTETLKNLGAVYQVSSAWRVFANYAEAFSMPDVGRVLRGINVDDQTVETFLDLKPILTENTELGLEYKSESVDAEFAYFVSDSDFGQRLQRGDDGIYTVKREKTEVDGIELNVDWSLTGSDELGLGYASTTGRYDSNADGKVDSDLGGSNIAPDRLNLSWNRDWSASLRTRLQFNHLFDRDFENSEGENIRTFGGYSSVDLNADFAAFGGSLSLAIQNLGNTDYFTYYSQVNPNAARYFKGMGRSFSVSWRRDF
ncbi:TonB-dependent receptor [Teredinibacter haidensis]|uniref:TonB-dependent receptor n=1 Tax=Teredinibacter haidensis TaxID=2731755 RepID=UPI0009489531|nr:TonB-dependent receptor [Teredinibacter haidensis]